MITRVDRYDIKEVNTVLRKTGITKIKINTKQLQEEIERLYTTKNYLQWDKKVIAEECCRGLHKLLASAEKWKNNEINVSWESKLQGISATPNVNICSRLVDISLTKYMDTQLGCALITVDYTSLLEAVCFEIVHRDMGISTDEVFTRLGGDVLTPIDREVLNSYIQGTLFINRCKDIHIKDSMYVPMDAEYGYTYFYSKVQKAKTYKALITATLSQILAKIYVYKVREFVRNKVYRFKLCCIGDSLIVLQVQNENEPQIRQLLKRPVEIQLFGHRISYTPRLYYTHYTADDFSFLLNK